MSISMAIVAQLVRALDCGSKCRGFESRRSPILIVNNPAQNKKVYYLNSLKILWQQLFEI